MKFLLDTLFSLVAAALVVTAATAEERRPHGRLWRWSVVAYSGAVAADAASSWGRPELNPVLRGADGRFDGRSMLVKGALSGGWLLIQWGAVRANPKLERVFSRINFVAAGATGAVAVRNARLP